MGGNQEQKGAQEQGESTKVLRPRLEGEGTVTREVVLGEETTVGTEGHRGSKEVQQSGPTLVVVLLKVPLANLSP